MKLSEWIKKYRSEHELSTIAFASLTGLSSSYINLLERDWNPTTKKPMSPSLKALKSIASAVGLEVDDLLKQLDDDQPVIATPAPADDAAGDDDEQETYYIDPEARRIANELKDNREMRILFDAGRNAKPEDLLMAAQILKRMKGETDD